MSWSFAAIGRPAGVAKMAEKELSAYKSDEPEETIRSKIAEIIKVACAASPPGVAIKVTASGGQVAWGEVVEGQSNNSVILTIEPLFGFIE